MSAPDPVPVEIRDRIKRAREAVSATALKDASGDYAAKWRELAAAKRELADAYEAAYAVVSPSLTLSDALLDARIGLRVEADAMEREAHEVEHGRRRSWRQA